MFRYACKTFGEDELPLSRVSSGVCSEHWNSAWSCQLNRDREISEESLIFYVVVKTAKLLVFAE